MTAPVDEFLRCSLGGPLSRAELLLAQHPQIARHDLRTALVLGDVEHVRVVLAADPAAAFRPDPAEGRPPLLDVCASLWGSQAALWGKPHREAELLEIARLLVDAGAHPNTAHANSYRRTVSALDAAVGRDHIGIVELLLERGAYPTETHLSIATGGRDLIVLRMLLARIRPVPGSTVLTGPISDGRTEVVRLLLEHGFEPNRLLPGRSFREWYDDENYDEDWAMEMGLRHYPPIHPLLAAVRSDAPIELFAALVEHGARHPDAATQARRAGKTEIADLLERYDQSAETTFPYDQSARYTD